jgi:hypothetical protein
MRVDVLDVKENKDRPKDLRQTLNRSSLTAFNTDLVNNNNNSKVKKEPPRKRNLIFI